MKMIEKAALAMLEDLEEQADDGKPGPYVDGSVKTLNDVLVDGRIDLLRLAKVVLLAVRDPSEEVEYQAAKDWAAKYRETKGQQNHGRVLWQAMIDAALEEGP